MPSALWFGISESLMVKTESTRGTSDKSMYRSEVDRAGEKFKH